MGVAEPMPRQALGGRVHMVEAPTDDVGAFRVLFKITKRILFQNIVQPSCSSRREFSFETACCDVATLVARTYCRTSQSDTLDEAALAASLAFCGVRSPCLGSKQRRRRRSHAACAAPTFPSAAMARVFACNHNLLAHLVSGDAVAVVVEQCLRRAMLQTSDFFLVTCLVVEHMADRTARTVAALQVDGVTAGYAFEPVRVTFRHAAGDGGGDDGAFVEWSIVFPARKVFAAFLANRALWRHLRHKPVFSLLEVGSTLLRSQGRDPPSPHLLAWLRAEVKGSSSSGVST